MKVVSSQARPTPDAPQGNWIFAPLPRPSFTDTLKFPDDITRLSLKDVSALHGQYTALYAYAVSEVAKVNQELLRLDSAIFRQRNNVSRTGHTYNKNKYAIDVMVRVDKKLEELTLQKNSVSERKEVIDRFIDIYEKYASALSREITRRTAELNLR